MMRDEREPRTIRIIAPSQSMATLRPDVCRVGIARLERLGFRVELGAHVREVALHRTASVAHRLADLDAALDDPSVDVVLAAQGGSNSNQLLERIDYARARRANKVFVGFSDISALLLALGKHAGASVVHGPSFIDLCNPILPDYTTKGLLACLAGRRVEYASPSAAAEDLWRSHAPSPPEPHCLFDGWKVLRRGKASGPIVGGNLATLSALAGTRHFPETAGRIFFLEDAVGEGAGAIHRELTHLAQVGAFDGIAAFLFGKVPAGAPLASPEMVRAILDDVLAGGGAYPIAFEVTCSHLSPMVSIPLFRPAELDLDGPPRLIVNADRPGEAVHVDGSDALTQSVTSSA